MRRVSDARNSLQGCCCLQVKGRKRTKTKLFCGPKSPTWGTPFLTQTSPEKVDVGLFSCVLSQEMRHTNSFIDPRMCPVWWGESKKCYVEKSMWVFLSLTNACQPHHPGSASRLAELLHGRTEHSPREGRDPVVDYAKGARPQLFLSGTRQSYSEKVALGFPAERTKKIQAPIILALPFPAPELRTEKLRT